MAYFGSKATSGLCQPLIAMMPPHDTYIETHLGGGAIMRRKPAALHNIGIDRDARALGEFECDYPVELIHGCAHRFLSEYAFVGSELLGQRPAVSAVTRTRTSMRRYRFDVRGAPDPMSSCWSHLEVAVRPAFRLMDSSSEIATALLGHETSSA